MIGVWVPWHVSRVYTSDTSDLPYREGPQRSSVKRRNHEDARVEFGECEEAPDPNPAILLYSAGGVLGVPIYFTSRNTQSRRFLAEQEGSRAVERLQGQTVQVLRNKR